MWKVASFNDISASGGAERLMASQILVEESMPFFGVVKVFKIVGIGISSTQQVAQILCCGPHHLMIVPSILAHYLERFADSQILYLRRVLVDNDYGKRRLLIGDIVAPIFVNGDAPKKKS